MAQILVNSRMAAEGHRPICQDTGIAIAFIRVGMDVRWDTKLALQQMVDEGVRRAYTDRDNPLRASMLADPDGARATPATTRRRGARRAGPRRQGRGDRRGQGRRLREQVQVRDAATRATRIVDWVLSVVPTMGADWCPPGILSLGIGGSPEKAMLMAKGR
jgi:fumarate hydratase, class I